LQAHLLADGVLRSLVPLVAATLALAGALTAMCFVKVYGIAFLGQRREPRHAVASGHDGQDASGCERIGMAWLALWCIVLGIFPTWMLALLDQVSVTLLGQGLPSGAHGSGWLWLAPTSPERASYSPLIFALVISIVFALTYWAVRWIWHGRMRRVPPWDCGYPEQNARMQDTADAFGQPIRWIFAPIYRIESRMPAPDDREPRYALKIEDRFWRGLYLPIARAAEFVSERVGMLQMGKISVYLLYSFITLIALLVFVR
jgi:NADH:ubiquinone oxidoreductase subunit 5 (subunit L)/multisubunit Na+/H+ antiporter MnhA subunit